MATFRRSAATVALALSPVAAATPAETQEHVDEMQIEVGELVFDAVVDGPEDGPVVFMLHGFPQSAYEWRYQIPVLASMGFRVIAPDQRGYSPGARPQGVEAYAIPSLVGDLIGMADAVGAEHLVVVSGWECTLLRETLRN